MMLIAALILATSLSAGLAARAAEPEIRATAPAAAPPAPDVTDQIDTYLRTSPPAALPKDRASGVTTGDEPRKAHGFVDVTVGSGGYRSAFVQGDLPVGRTGTLSIAVGESRFNGRSGAYGDGVGGYARTYGDAYGGRSSRSDPQDPRCRQRGDEIGDSRFSDSPPRLCQAAGAQGSPW